MKKLFFTVCLLLGTHISYASKDTHKELNEEHRPKISRHGHAYNLKKASEDEKALLQLRHQNKISSLQITPSTKLSQETNLAIYIKTIKDQGNLGACTGFATSYGSEIVLMWQQGEQKWTQLSPRFVYDQELLQQGSLGQDVGSTISMAISVLCSHGICPETLDPYTDDIRQYLKGPSVKQYLSALKYMDKDKISILSVPQDRNHFLSALNAKYPIIMGISVYDSFESDQTAKTGLVPLPNQNTESLLGGHAICMIGSGYDQGYHFGYYFVNSWGPNWGMKKTIAHANKTGGFFFLPAQYVEDATLNLASEFYAIHQINNK